MMKIFIKISLIMATALLMATVDTGAQEQTAKEIIQKSIDKLNGESSRGEMKMTIVRPSWSREVTMKTWSMGEDYYMILITSPPREKGQVFLKRNYDMWNWMPTINRMIKIPPSMMSQSWMGSDFTNDDLVKMNSYVDDYESEIIGEEVVEDHDCHKIELIPEPDAAVVWGKVLLWISKEEYYQLRLEFYDEEMELVNTQVCSEIKQMGDRKLPGKLVMTPVNKEGQKTIIEIIEMEFDIDIEREFFSQQNMKRVK